MLVFTEIVFLNSVSNYYYFGHCVLFTLISDFDFAVVFWLMTYSVVAKSKSEHQMLTVTSPYRVEMTMPVTSSYYNQKQWWPRMVPPSQCKWKLTPMPVASKFIVPNLRTWQLGHRFHLQSAEEPPASRRTKAVSMWQGHTKTSAPSSGLWRPVWW